MLAIEMAQATPRPQSRTRPTSGGVGEYFRYHGWLSPGVRLFRSLSFQAKSVWISMAFLAPLSLALFYLWSAASGQVETAHAERRGMTYSTGIIKLIQVAQSRRLAAATNPAALPSLQEQERAAFETVAQLQKNLGAEFNLSATYTKAQELQEQLQRNAQSGDALATFIMHSNYIDALLNLNRSVADGSQLALDPDLDTYHMMNISVLQGPALSEMTARLRDLGMMALLTKSISPQQRDLLLEDGAIQKKIVSDIRDSYQSGMASDTVAAGRMDMAGINAASAAQRQALKQQVLGAELGADAAAYLARSNDAGALQQTALEQVAAELDRRLLLRISHVNGIFRGQLAVSLAFICLAGYLLLSFYKVMMGGLQEVAAHLEQITDGNLTTAPAPWGSDEAAQLMITMGKMQASLRRMVSTVIDSSAGVQVASEEIASASVDLSRRTEDTAASLEETAASMEQISATVKNNADAVKNVVLIVNENAGAATRGGQVIAEVVSRMDGIQQSSRKIEEIISVIDGIAFQTNILALNAAVEAARAGEQGRGFAVVASEVRNLAQRSATAAKEIKDLIGSSMEQVTAGNIVAIEAGKTIADIVGNATRIESLMREVSISTEEQSRSIAQVSSAVEALDESTQQNAALVEETAAASGTLSEQAQKLNAEISFFKLK